MRVGPRLVARLSPVNRDLRLPTSFVGETAGGCAPPEVLAPFASTPLFRVRLVDQRRAERSNLLHNVSTFGGPWIGRPRMKCPRCQHESPADAVFCQECGRRLEEACPGCGTANRLDAKFCKKCGQPVAVRPPAATAVKFPPPVSYTPKHLAEKILTSKSALEGERKLVTVLFADLKGSMELLADRDPEEARKLLDPVLERMMEAVHRYEGTVNQVMGDGIMALFGAPLAHEDHAVRACYAALRMQESV